MASSEGPIVDLRFDARFFTGAFRAEAISFFFVDLRLVGACCCSLERIPSASAADVPPVFPFVDFGFRATILRWKPNTVHV
jgi:hypothetical protein